MDWQDDSRVIDLEIVLVLLRDDHYYSICHMLQANGRIRMILADVSRSILDFAPSIWTFNMAKRYDGRYYGSGLGAHHDRCFDMWLFDNLCWGVWPWSPSWLNYFEKSFRNELKINDFESTDIFLYVCITSFRSCDRRFHLQGTGDMGRDTNLIKKRFCTAVDK